MFKTRQIDIVGRGLKIEGMVFITDYCFHKFCILIFEHRSLKFMQALHVMDGDSMIYTDYETFCQPQQ